MRKAVVIGLGSPVLSDDSVGLKVARALAETLSGDGGVEVKELHAGGIRLMEAMEGYGRAIIVDAMVTGGVRAGSMRWASLDGLPSARNITSVHDMDLKTALEMGRTLGMSLPEEISLLGIEVRDVDTFGEALSEEVAEAVPAAVHEITMALSHSEAGVR